MFLKENPDKKKIGKDVKELLLTTYLNICMAHPIPDIYFRGLNWIFDFLVIKLTLLATFILFGEQINGLVSIW